MSDTTLPVTDADGVERDVAFDLTGGVYTPKTYALQSGTWTVGISGTVTVDGTVNAVQSGAWTVAQSGSWTVAATQSGSWTVAATQSGTWTVGLSAGSNTIGKVDHTTTGVGHGIKTVTTAGTDVVLASSTAAKWVIIQAQTDNTGLIAVGATGVDATEATGTGVALEAGESITLPCDNLSDIFIDATVSGEGVRYTYGT